MKEAYELIRSARKTLSLEVRADGTLLVRSPYLESAERIDRFVESHTVWIERTRSRVKARRELFPELTKSECEELRRKAQAELPERVAYYADLTGLYPTSVRITSAKTRFGSCNAQNGICFSLYLMRYPADFIDYVVLHELAHTKHHNHSAAFYALIERYMPDYKERLRHRL